MPVSSDPHAWLRPIYACLRADRSFPLPSLPISSNALGEYDSAMFSREVITPVLTFILGVAVGALSKYFADHGTELRKDRKARKQTVTQFEKLQRVMPGLVAAIKQDLEKWPDVREFAVLGSAGQHFNYPHAHFIYCEQDYENLRSKLVMLEDAGYISDHSKSVPFYRMTDEFVDLVLKE